MSPGPDPGIAEEKLALLFALLFSSPEPVTLDRIRQVLYPAPPAEGQDGAEGPASEDEERHSPGEHLQALESWIEAKGLPLKLHRVGKSWRLLTSEAVAQALAPVRKQVHKERVGPAALEVLALVAYRQPVLKADVDAIRGVNSGPHLRHLLDLRLIRILGRADLPGRPFLYGTTRDFLDRFGLRDLQDLPRAERLAFPAEAPPSGRGEPGEAGEPEEAGAEAAPAGPG